MQVLTLNDSASVSVREWGVGSLSIVAPYIGILVYTKYAKICIKQITGHLCLSTAPVAA